jgi:predicted CoA-binding protein
MDWRSNLIEDPAGLRELIQGARRIAVLGMEPAENSTRPAYYVPHYLQRAGFEIIPVPVKYPNLEEIDGRRAHRRVADIPGEIDIVDVFRTPRDIPKHLDDLLAKKPKSVWFQSGIRNDAAAQKLAEAGIKVVQDRCLMVEHRRVARLLDPRFR